MRDAQLNAQEFQKLRHAEARAERAKAAQIEREANTFKVAVEQARAGALQGIHDPAMIEHVSKEFDRLVLEARLKFVVGNLSTKVNAAIFGQRNNTAQL